jgi:hypothetical protein
MENEYNGKTHTFVAEPLINQTWANLSNEQAGLGAGVTVGTDNWYVNSDSDVLEQQPFYNRLGGNSPADMVCYFYQNDRIYIRDLTIYCNFADGLVRQANMVRTPADPIATNALPDFQLSGELKIQIINKYWDPIAGAVVEAGSSIYPMRHFNLTYNLGVFAPEDTPNFKERYRARWLEVKLIPNTGNSSVYSTKGIDTSYQTDRVIVWAEATLSHSFDIYDRDDVIGGQTNWPIV